MTTTTHSATTPAVLEVRNIRVGFRRRRKDPLFWALDDVSLTVTPGPHHGPDRRIRLRQIHPGQRRPRPGAGAVRQRELAGPGHHRLSAAQRRSPGAHPAGGVPGPEQLPQPVLDTIGRSLAEPMRAQGIRSKERDRTSAPQHARRTSA